MVVGDLPIPESAHTSPKVAPSLVRWVYQDLDVHLGELFGYPFPQVFCEPIVLPEGCFTPLRTLVREPPR